MKPLRMGVVGVGALGQHHARILSHLDAVELVGVVDSRPEQGTAVAEKLGCQWFPDAEQLLGRVDAVSIAAPTFLHHEIASRFLVHEIPVLVEKPLAASVTEAEALVRLADQFRTPLQVGHIERFNPATAAAWKLIDEPRYIRAERISPFTFRSTDIGVVHDLMIHDIDLILALVDAPVEKVEAMGIAVMGANEDAAQARLHFANGCIADLTASRICPNASRSHQIWSASGCTTVDFTTRKVEHFAPTEMLRYGTPPVERALEPGADINQLKADVFGKLIQVSRPRVSDEDALTAELSSFVKSVVQRVTPEVDGRAGLRAMQVADQVIGQINSHAWDGSIAGRVGPRIGAIPRRRMAG